MPPRPRAPRLARPLVLALALAGCGGAPAIELRLHPCDVGGEPGSVRVAIQARGSDGAAIGEPATAAFSISDPAIFADGFATAAYEPPEGAVRADFTIAWFLAASAGALAESDHVVVAAGVALPKSGGVIELEAEGCEPLDGGTTSESDTTTDGTSTSTTDDTSTSADTTTSTTDVTTTSTTDVTTTSTTEITTTTTTTGEPTTSTTEDTTTTGTGGPMEGGPCDPEVDDAPFCVTAGGGQVGQLLHCVDQGGMGVWMDGLQSGCGFICTLPFYELQNGVPAGCSGNGAGPDWGCLCAEAGGKSCTASDQKCAFEDQTETIYLCVADDLLKGSCQEGKCVGDDQPICVP